MAEDLQLTETPAWRALQAHYEKIKDIHLRQLFADDSNRGERLTARGAGLYLDYSKNRITDATLRLLVQLAAERGVARRRDAMFEGDKINFTENRAVLHVALRAPQRSKIQVDGIDVVSEVHGVLQKMAAFADRVRAGERNLPMLMGLFTVWYNNFFNAQTVGIMPYANNLRRFPAYLQQLQMESNGKHVDLDARPVNYQTGAIIWGEPGTDGQHSFYQLVHQGTKIIPCDLIGFCQPLSELAGHHDLLMANMFAQAEALAFGKTGDELKAEGSPDFQTPFRVCDGNRPTNVILAEKLTPKTLGALVALFEHNVFTQGAVWNIDSFDQWGVELGKVLARRIIPELESGGTPELKHDSSTNTLIRLYRHSLGR